MSHGAQDSAGRQATLQTFGGLVQALRGISAARLHQARARLADVEPWAATIETTLRQARAWLPPGAVTAVPWAAAATPDRGEPAGPTGPAGSAAQADPAGQTARAHPAAGTVITVLLGVEQSFAGAHAQALIQTAAATGALHGRLLLLGSQTLRQARARGCTPRWSARLPARADSVPALAETLHAALAAELQRAPARRVELIHGEVDAAGGHARVRRVDLLPLPPAPEPAPPPAHDAPRRGPPPLHHLPAPQLLEALLLEHITARLCRALLQAHAAEHLARLQALQAAGDNVERLRQTLAADERRQRQEAITAEIVELAAALRTRGAT